jgi:hypothetical protein
VTNLDHSASSRWASTRYNFVSGSNFFAKKSKIFDEIVGFTKFSEYLIVAEVCYVCFCLRLVANEISV